MHISLGEVLTFGIFLIALLTYDDKTGRLVTIQEGGYVRQYIVGSDGSKILVSEIKQETNQTTPTENCKNNSPYFKVTK